MSERVFQDDFTPYVAVPAEGIRIAVTTCKTCGAAVQWSGHDEIDSLEVHLSWHEAGR